MHPNENPNFWKVKGGEKTEGTIRGREWEGFPGGKKKVESLQKGLSSILGFLNLRSKLVFLIGGTAFTSTITSNL